MSCKSSSRYGNLSFYVATAILLFLVERSHGQLAQWISPYLPVIPGESVSTGVQYRQREVLNETTGTILEWSVDLRNSSVPTASSSITFNFTTRLNPDNYLVLGLSTRGQVNGADAVLLIALESEQPSLLDMHGTDNSTLTRDASQNWQLGRVAWVPTQGNGSVSVIISRNLDTCDTQDIPINNYMLHVLWGFGTNASAESSFVSFTPEGSVRAYLTDPVRPNVTLNETRQTWRVARNFLVPSRRTSYWCSIHKGPTLTSRQHIIGYAPYFSNASSERHVHHQLVYRCIAPPGADAANIFERYLSHPGEECYLEVSHQIPTHFCTEILHIWGVGGKPFSFPDNLGMSIGENANEYFMLESHYDNPDLRTDLVVENGVDFLYTTALRPEEGGILFVGSGVLGLYMIPPNTTNFTHGGQCSSECTTEMLNGLGGGGANVMATMLHSHQATHKMHVKHYRSATELPRIQSDENYDFSFQQMRHLPQPLKILPGDTVGVECVMDTTSRNSTTLSGFSTQDEMCVAFLLVNKRLGYLYCSSEYPTNVTLARYGIQNVTWDRELQERVVNQAKNTSLVGRTLKDALDLETWTEERKRELEREQYFGTHNSACPPVRKLALITHAAYLMEEVTLGIISLRERIERRRISVLTVDTPTLANTTTQWPVPQIQYERPQQCPTT